MQSLLKLELSLANQLLGEVVSLDELFEKMQHYREALPTVYLLCYLYDAAQ